MRVEFAKIVKTWRIKFVELKFALGVIHSEHEEGRLGEVKIFAMFDEPLY